MRRSERLESFPNSDHHPYHANYYFYNLWVLRANCRLHLCLALVPVLALALALALVLLLLWQPAPS